jgi:cold shock CspA family protein
MTSGMKMGQLVKWNDERGFGFITPSVGGNQVFLHISAIPKTSRRPRVGDTISYALVTEADGRTRASSASIQGIVLQTSGFNKTRTSPNHRRNKSHRSKELAIGAGVFVGLVLLLMQCRSGMSPSRSPSRMPASIESITKPGCVVKGNISINSGRMLYHVPGMEDYEGTIIDPDKGERWFCSEAEAVAAGWHRAPR